MRIDLVFSYWIFGWFLLYLGKFTSFSPKFVLIVGLIENVMMWIAMFMYATPLFTIGSFMLINLFIKIIPLWYLRKESIRLKDIYATIGLGVLFTVWLHINHQSLIGNMKLIHDALLYGKNTTPFISFLTQFKQNIKKIH
jgi:hypothetical protein